MGGGREREGGKQTSLVCKERKRREEWDNKQKRERNWDEKEILKERKEKEKILKVQRKAIMIQRPIIWCGNIAK